MGLRSFTILVGLLVLISGVAMLGEHPVAAPGAISSVHAELADDGAEIACRACHTPFDSVEAGCESCHAPLPEANLHADEGIACSSCHLEHAGREASLIAPAQASCTQCHAHSSLRAVEGHAIGGSGEMTRLIDLADPARAQAPAFQSFSHAAHFDERAFECQDCHFPGEQAEATMQRNDGIEQLLRWSGCQECHDDWRDAGFDAQRRAAPMAPLVLARMPRIVYAHSPAHLETDCESCHVSIGDAGALEDATSIAAASAVASCFQCHGEPAVATGAVAPDSTLASLGECSDCHAFHGEAHESDFPNGASDTPKPEGDDVFARASLGAAGAGLAFTPWLLGFVGLAGVGWVQVLRKLPAGDDRAGGDPETSAQRVMEVPVLSPSFESSVPGVYIIGELAGVPLVNRAMKSGFDAIDYIANRLEVEGRGGESADEVLDVLIVGSGPAGLGAATRAKHLGLSHIVCEKSTPAATIRNYQRNKIIQAAPIDIPDYGSFFQEDDESKEALVRRWEDIISRTGIEIAEREEVTGIDAHADGGLEVAVDTGKQYRARTVVLALGMRGTPRRLGLDGETGERVDYLLIDAEEHREQDILVVGGGNAAIEAALSLSNPGLMNRVTISCIEPVLTYVTAENMQQVDAAVGEDRIDLICGSSVTAIHDGSVVLDSPAGERKIDNHFIFVMIGAELPMPFLKQIGIKLVRKGGV